jgi:hypothetical protein
MKNKEGWYMEKIYKISIISILLTLAFLTLNAAALKIFIGPPINV